MFARRSILQTHSLQLNFRRNYHSLKPPTLRTTCFPKRNANNQIRRFADSTEPQSNVGVKRIKNPSLEDRDKPNHLLRILLTTSAIGGVGIMIFGLPPSLEALLNEKFPDYDFSFEKLDISKMLPTWPSSSDTSSKESKPSTPPPPTPSKPPQTESKPILPEIKSTLSNWFASLKPAPSESKEEVSTPPPPPSPPVKSEPTVDPTPPPTPPKSKRKVLPKPPPIPKPVVETPPPVIPTPPPPPPPPKQPEPEPKPSGRNLKKLGKRGRQSDVPKVPIATPAPVVTAAPVITKPKRTGPSKADESIAMLRGSVGKNEQIDDDDIKRFLKLKRQYEALEAEKQKQSLPFVRDPPNIIHTQLTVDQSNENLIKELKRKLKLAEQRIGEMEGALIERDEFIVENVKKLEEGSKAYQEIIRMYDEMQEEYREQMLNEMEFMEADRQKRWKDLKQNTIDIRVFDVLLSWFDKNSEFFASLAEYNNIISSMETKFNNGVSFDKELDRLLQHIPNTFLSKKLLNDLQVDLHNNKTNLIYSHSQLYDRYCVLEQSLRETSMTPRDTDSLWANLWAKMFSSLLLREQIAREGTDAQARISRAGYAMKTGDLRSALTELNYLDETTLYPAQDWLRCARERLLGIYAIEMLKSELLSRSLNIGYTETTEQI